MSDLKSLEDRATSELAACASEADLRAWHAKYFGKNGEVLAALKNVAVVPKEQKPAYGQEANRIKVALTTAYQAKEDQEKEQALAKTLAAEAIDVTLPGRPVQRGRLHVATKIMREIYGIF